MPGRHKGKPSGKFAESKTDAGRKGNYKRSGWPEEAATQRMGERGRRSGAEDAETRQGRNRKAGSPI